MEARSAAIDGRVRDVDASGSVKQGVDYSKLKPLQQIPREERREVILERIVHFLNTEGSNESDWSLSQFAKVANTSRVTLYEYFGNLEGLRNAIRMQIVGDVETIVEKLNRFPADEQHRIAVDQWMDWLDENRKLAIRALWIDESNPAFATFVADNRDLLIRQICQVFLGVTKATPSLMRQIEIYLGAAEYCLRMWLLEGRMQRHEVRDTFERLAGDAVRMGEQRKDVPKPLPGQS